MANTKTDHKPRANPLRIMIWGAATVALMVPWIAMQFTSEVVWDVTDFVVFGTMLLVVCGTYELVTRLTGNKAYRLAVGIALSGVFLLTWMNLAVGIIGNEGNPANLMFLAMPLVGIIGALITRFKSRGMARTLVAMAITQAIVALITLIAGWGFIFVLTGFFIVVWLTSAHLFHKAAQQSSSRSQTNP